MIPRLFLREGTRTFPTPWLHLSQTSSKEGPKHSPGGAWAPQSLWILGRCSTTSRPHPRACPGLIPNEVAKETQPRPRKNQHQHLNIHPAFDSFWNPQGDLQLRTRSNSIFTTKSSEAWLGSTLPFLRGKSRPRGVGGIGALPLGCSSSNSRACLAPRAHSASVMVGCFSNRRNQAHPADFLPHTSHKDF